MINRSLLNRVAQLEADKGVDPELLAEKINLALTEMVRSLPFDPAEPDFDFNEFKQGVLYGHHPRPKNT